MHDTYYDSCTQHSLRTPQYHSGLTFPQLLLALTLLLTASISVANERASNNEPSSEIGTLMLIGEQERFEAVQLDATMQVEVSGLLAQMSLTQTFRNTRNAWMQARYLFPLPESATVQSLVINVDGRTIHGKIMEREAAQKTFTQASENGQITALVEQQRPNLFTMDVATIAPGSELSVELIIMLPVQIDRQFRSLTLPTTHTPRYINKQTPNAAAVHGAFTTSSSQRGPRLTMNATIEGLTDYSRVTSDTHSLNATAASVALQNVPMDKDLVIKWPADYADTAKSLIYISEHGKEQYAQILLNPPSNPSVENTVRRELIIVVDKSGSMAGESMDAARKALQFSIDSLKPEDTFNIIAFDDQSYPLFQSTLAADDTNLKLAHRFIRNLDADGGTEMRESLRFALRAKINPDDTRLRQVVFLTDGSVGYEDALLLEIQRQLGKSRLFTIGIGSAPNQWFLEKAAQIGRGVFLTIPDSGAAADAIQLLLTNLKNPVITDIDVQFIGGKGEIHPNPIADLYADKPQIMVAKIDAQVRNILVSGNQWLDGEIVRWQQRLDIPTQATTHAEANNSLESVVPTLPETVPSAKLFWARLKVESLLDEQRYAADNDVNKQQILQLALNAQLVTPYTSFVAVEQKPVRTENEPLAKTEVASLVPHGNTMMELAMPVGAAGVDTLGWMSALLGLFGIVLMYLSQLRFKRYGNI